MVVQHNMQAMNANRMLNITTGAQGKSTEKLSSGYKVNRAADDAAGLSISEKMRRQIRGLDRASTNAQDGISSVQTAEGALNEVHDMLQRMNELANQASNGTNSTTDRQAIQDEISQLNTEIDRVAETTKFNELYLLKGRSGTKEINLNGHDAGLKGQLSDQGDTAVFTMELKTDTDVSIAGKSYHVYDDGDTLKTFQDQVDDAESVTINGTTYKNSGITAGTAGTGATASEVAAKRECAEGRTACADKNKTYAGKQQFCAAKKRECAAVMKGKATSTSKKAASLNTMAAQRDESAGKFLDSAEKLDASAKALLACAEKMSAGGSTASEVAKKKECAEGRTACADKNRGCAGKQQTCAAKKRECAAAMKEKATSTSKKAASLNKMAAQRDESAGKFLDSAEKLDACAAALMASADKMEGSSASGSPTKIFTSNDKEYTADELKSMIVDGAKVGINGAKARTAVDLDNNKNNKSIDDIKSLAKDALLQANQIGVDDETKVKVSDAVDNGDDTITYTITKGTVEVAKELSFDLHVGADADLTNKIGVDIETMNSKYLGVQDLKVVDDSGIMATYAIDAIEDAITKVNEQRSALGAVQNRLEHTITNLDNVAENTQSAESSIRDTDIADEMVRYSKNNILSQAGQSMLAQANQSTQGALSLLG